MTNSPYAIKINKKYIFLKKHIPYIIYHIPYMES